MRTSLYSCHPVDQQDLSCGSLRLPCPFARLPPSILPSSRVLRSARERHPALSPGTGRRVLRAGSPACVQGSHRGSATPRNPAPVIDGRGRQAGQRIVLDHREDEGAAATLLPSCGSLGRDQVEARRERRSGPSAGPGPRGRARPCGRTCSRKSGSDDGRSLAGERCRGAPCSRSVAVMPAINGLLSRSLTEAGG